jgi:predicted glycoside hydrolase/deacetylase ChbG (UPF0249 family)
MKMIIRADDVGYSDVFNMGTFKTIEQGVVTSADVMLDTPGTVDALHRLRDLPWISIGWHVHFWGSPLLEPHLIPSLLDANTGRFRNNLRFLEDVNLDEAIAECRAEMERCVKILGKAPDTTEFPASIIGQAVKQVSDEYGIVYEFANKRHTPPGGPTKISKPSERWASRKIHVLDPKSAYAELLTDSVTDVEKYDPVNYYLEDRCHLADFPEDAVVEQSWHPGYLDYFVYRQGDPGPFARNFTLGRVIDVEALCSDRLKNWIKEKQIELVNFRDALYGTREYQNHLRLIGSDLARS